MSSQLGSSALSPIFVVSCARLCAVQDVASQATRDVVDDAKWRDEVMVSALPDLVACLRVHRTNLCG